MKKTKARFQWVGIMAVIFAVTFASNLLSVHLAAAQQERMKQVVSQEAYELETITVTAQKREENVQDVPMSMSVFSDIELEDADIRNTLELTRFSPNLHMIKSLTENWIVFRGITTVTPSIYSPAGFYVDDVSFPLHYMHNPDLFDIERIEVLKGPQGTLYGRNSESGVINIITKKPDNTVRGEIFGEYGTYDTEHGNPPSYRAGGSISGPIVRDKLYLKLAGQWEDSDGYMENKYNDDEEAGKKEHTNGRGTLRWTPTDRWDLSFIADAMDADDKIGFFRYMTGPQKTDRYEIEHDSEDYSEQDGNGQTLRIKYEGDSFNLLSVSGLRYYQREYALDADCYADPANYLGRSCFTFEDRLLSEELRISSPKDSGPFEWLIGVYVSKEETDIDFSRPVFGMNRDADLDISSFAIFTQDTYTLFDRLHITAGLRYDHQDLEGKQKYEFINMMTGSPQSLNFDKDLDYDEFLPKFSIAFDFTDDIMSYVTVSRGYLAGGYNYAMAGDIDSFTYDPEYTWNYEAGIKTAWLDRKVMANLAMFYIDIKDKQVKEFDPGSMGYNIENAAKAHSCGFELELRARPMQGLDVFGGFGYTEAKFDDWTATEMDRSTSPPSIIQYDYKDKYLINAPKYTYNLGVQYRHECGFFGRVDLLGTGNFYGDAKNKVKENAYELINLRLGYEREHFDIKLWCKNLLDEEYETAKHDWFGEELVHDGPPRMYGVTATYRF